MQVVRDDLWFCVDCTLYAVNGDASSLDYHYGKKADERLIEIENGLNRFGAHVVPDFDADTGDGHEEFANYGCDCCGSPLAGEIHSVRNRFQRR